MKRLKIRMHEDEIMAIVVKAPNEWPGMHPLVFLAGSIEMGKAAHWQVRIEEALADWPGVILNPRREDWEAGLTQADVDDEFVKQVEWELRALEAADVIVMHFEPGTLSPITLLELGLYARSGKLIVHCPVGYWRRGNVKVVCHKYNIPFVDSIDDLLSHIKLTSGDKHTL